MTVAVLCSNGVREVLRELIPGFERSSGHKLSIEFDSSSAIVQRVESGAFADLVILTAETADALVREGRLIAASRTELARCGIALAVRAGAPKPALGTVGELRDTLLKARSIAYSVAGASAGHFMSVLERLGITDEVKARLQPVRGRPVGEVLAQGEAQIGVQQLSELLPVAGIDIAGPLPEGLQKRTVFVAVLTPLARSPDAAMALAALVASKKSRALLRSCGMEPVL
jgi:molybdate transport system substrate-binding protein